MNNQTYSYKFGPKTSMSDVEETLLLAVIAAEGLHGRSKINLDASFMLIEEDRACVIDADNQVGQDIARIFTGLLACEFGEDSFTVVCEKTSGHEEVAS